MNKTTSFFLSIITIMFSLTINSPGQSIEQRLLVVQNDGIVGGSFKVAVQVKGTNLTAANTIGSATIDVQFNNLQLTYINATNSSATNGPVGLNGYSKTNTNNGTFIRVGVLATNVNPENFAGFDLGSTYTTWSTLNFNIQSLTTTSLNIINGTNAIGLFENHSNDPATGIINNQTLTAPENISNVPLPVELSSFTGKVLDGNEVKLNWITKTETNNYGFNVERRIKDGQWNKLGFVEGSGNSNSPKNYSFTDKDLFAGGSKFEYRLKQIDNDGAFEYSDIVEVTVMPTEYELSQNFPNPFNPSTTIRFSLPTETRLKINIYNMLGQLVETLAEGNFEAGYHKVTFNASTLPSGAYIYRIESSEFTQVRKMILIK